MLQWYSVLELLVEQMYENFKIPFTVYFHLEYRWLTHFRSNYIYFFVNVKMSKIKYEKMVIGMVWFCRFNFTLKEKIENFLACC